MTGEERESLSGAQRKYLRGLAHGLKPVVHIGRAGLSESLLSSLDEALESHELIKVKFHDHKEEKEAFRSEITSRLDCEVAGKIGHTMIFFRPARIPDNRKIKLP